MHRLIAALFVTFVTLPILQPVSAHEPMSLERMAEIVIALDPDAEQAGTFMRLTVEDVPVLIVTDPTANRMRAITAIRSSDSLNQAALLRMMQSNFDTALDARYAVANGKLWAAFIHPLADLDKDQLISGIGQVVNLALTYGSTYSSGALSFGGGDSRGLIQDLLKKGERI